MARIVILEHELQGRVALPYMVYSLAERWQRAGHSIVVHRGTSTPPEGDLAIVNIDLTVIPPVYRELFARYPRVVNGRVLDVSKRRFSVDLLDRYSDWIGPVIVKTDTNFAGKPEALLRRVAQQAGLACDIPEGPVAERYPIYPALRDVPESVWRTEGFVVERFLPERDAEGIYYSRHWVFFGDRDRSLRLRARTPIIKSGDAIGREEIPVPAELRAMRARLGFDFGKFDYVMHGPRHVLLDVNRTPSLPAYADAEVAAGQDYLATGLESLLR
ncbi:MAG: hypothetical protein ACREVQ_04325 [Burkholderiales bacterium]